MKSILFCKLSRATNIKLVLSHSTGKDPMEITCLEQECTTNMTITNQDKAKMRQDMVDGVLDGNNETCV